MGVARTRLRPGGRNLSVLCASAYSESDLILVRRKEPMCPANLERHPWHLLVSHSTKPIRDFRTVRLLVPTS
jgi:hypothetical protein